VRTIDTVVVGAGQAGLTMSWHLQQADRDHVVLDGRASLGGGWQDRWDAFRLVSPNWTASFPGHPYDGPDPDGFMPRDEIAGRVAGYAAVIGAPVELATEVRRLRLVGDRFRLETSGGPLEARTVVVATGGFHVPHRPPVAEQVPEAVVQLHSQQYRSASALPEGAVLVVGSGQSGVQIAEELQAAGRRVFLSVGSAGRLPRRYRGSDTFRWLAEVAERGDALGTPLPTADRLPDPRMRLAGNPHCSGHGGGHDTNLRQLAADGMTLLGRIDGVDGARLGLASDLAANLAWADRFFDERFRGLFDAFIERAEIDAPPDDREPFDFEPPVLAELDLERAGITTIVWTTGYRLDYGWIELPIFDELGFPRQVDGVSEAPGLFFLGSLWLRTQASSTLFGVGIDAGRLAAAMGLPGAA
jgi:putative flavoprotein involved in K+ transport